MVANVLRAVIRQPDIESLARTVVDEFLRVGLTGGTMWTAEEADGKLRRRSQRGLVETAQREIEAISVDELYALAPMLAGGRPMIIEDTAAAGIPPALLTGARRHNICSFFLAPLLTDNRLLGLLAGAFAAPRRFTDEERAGIDAIADVTAVTLDRLLARADERRAQHTVADREGRLRGVFDHMAHFFALLLPSGEVVDVNAAALAFMRMPRSSVVGRPVWDVPWVVEVGIVERGKADVAKAAAGERVVAEVPFEVPGGGGRMGTFEMTLSPVRDAGGDVRFLIYEARDVTEARDRERQLRELRRRMQLILDATYEGVIGVDGDGRIPSPTAAPGRSSAARPRRWRASTCRRSPSRPTTPREN